MKFLISNIRDALKRGKESWADALAKSALKKTYSVHTII
jgi:hypothetical protein